YFPTFQITNNIMETVTLEIVNKKAFSLLKELEKLQLIKIRKHEETNPSSQKLSEKFAGKLSALTAQQLDEHVNNIRNEWERNI
ncbi:MAG TPA: hypothetical protein VKA92_12750, partial [Segetibacter sp.]|nr:hypothetical protein [Segetibacter sp.]